MGYGGTMSSNIQRQNNELELILSDLNAIFQKDKIEIDEIDAVVEQLASDEVKTYITNLRRGSKPEAALREAFFAGKSRIGHYLADDWSPEINWGSGFIDYQIGSGNRSILLELKSLFEAETLSSKSGREIRWLKQKPLKWEDHKEQILKYIRQGGEYIVITNLKEWYFFNDTVSPDNCTPFYHTNLGNFVSDFTISGNLNDYLERQDFQAIREDLDRRFFESLKSWVKKLAEIQYTVSPQQKINLIISIINKFIFIQTLDDYGVVDFRWLKNTWDHAEQRWASKGKLRVLEAFFDEVVDWFYEYYDTELFREKVLEYVKRDDNDNIDKFYDTIKLILGLVYWQTALGGYRGILQYNFRYIDEDIFGRAYETFLAEVRHEEGIYYTPSHITEYIVERTIGHYFDQLLQKISTSLDSEDFDEVHRNVSKFINIKIIDPACGSGSFLVKATRKIMNRYLKISSMIEEAELKYNSTFMGKTVKVPDDINDKIEKLQLMKSILGTNSNRELISSILLRHIHGNDLDNRALGVAKVNLWLEGVKLAAQEFRYDKLPPDTNRILPDLELNLSNGDALVGLPNKLAIEVLSMHKAELREMSKLRTEYLNNPTKPELVEHAQSIKNKIRIELDINFDKYLKSLGSSLKPTRALHWALEFWHLFFNDNGEPYDVTDQGVDVLLGNPPYERIQVVKAKSEEYADYLSGADFQSSIGNYDLAVIFIERGYKLLNQSGEFGYIVTNKFMQGDYGTGIRKLLTSGKSIAEIVDFGDQQVFDNATTYTALIFLNKNKNETLKYVRVKRLIGSTEQMLSIMSNSNLNDNEKSISIRDSRNSLP